MLFLPAAFDAQACTPVSQPYATSATSATAGAWEVALGRQRDRGGDTRIQWYSIRRVAVPVVLLWTSVVGSVKIWLG